MACTPTAPEQAVVVQRCGLVSAKGRASTRPSRHELAEFSTARSEDSTIHGTEKDSAYPIYISIDLSIVFLSTYLHTYASIDLFSYQY